MRLSIRTKFTLALLVISLLSTTVVGGFAYLLLMRKFADVAEHAAAQNFRQDVSAYLDTYGSWQAAQAHEKFPAFAARRRLALGLPLTSGPAVPDFELFCPREENVQLTPLATADSAPLPGEPLRRPPFLFYLFDADMRALLPLEPYAVGDAVLAERHARLLPIESKGKVVAYFSPEGQVNYSEFDLGYLASIREALIYGSGAAVVLTLVLGMALGNRLSAAVMRLTTAAQAMTQGELKQRIPVDSRDEVGVLTETFNRMSEALAQSQEQVRSQAVQLKELSVRDSLTGLHNRRFFDEQARSLFERAVRDQRPFTVVIGDVDRFKWINDSFSHATGDDVLRQMGDILGRRLRTTDVVARYGGEEFAIAFPDTPPAAAAKVCEALRKSIEEHPWHEMHPDLKVTMSLGVYGDMSAGSLDAMLAAADRLLYRAKSSGRNRVCTVDGETGMGDTTCRS